MEASLVNEVGVRRATGMFGVMVGVIAVIELPLYLGCMILWW